MKKLSKVVCAVLITLFVMTSLVMTACGGGGSSPQSLAKQTWAEFEKAAKADGTQPNGMAFMAWSIKMTQEPTPAFTKINEKVEKLSEADQKVYQAEIQKLLGL